MDSRCGECGSPVRLNHDRKFVCMRDETHGEAIALGGPGSGWTAAGGHVKNEHSNQDFKSKDQANAHHDKEVARLKGMGFKSVGTFRNSDETGSTRETELSHPEGHTASVFTYHGKDSEIRGSSGREHSVDTRVDTKASLDRWNKSQGRKK